MGHDEYSLSPTASIVFCPREIKNLYQKNKLESLFRGLQNPEHIAFLRIKGEGYLYPSSEVRLYRDLNDRARLIIELLHIQKVIKFSRSRNIQYGITKTKTETIKQGFIVNESAQNEKPVQYDIPDDMNFYLSNTTQNEGLILDRSFFSSLRENYLSGLSRIESGEERILSAALWSFEARIDSSPTSSFIKTCIALEALLGEDSDRSNLTDKLAIKYSYLLGRNAQERKKIEADFKKIYHLRSKLVHGSLKNSTPLERSLIKKARILLEFSLIKEL